MNIALDQIRKLAIDDDSRRRLMVALHDLANSLEDPSDTLQRFGYLVCTLFSRLLMQVMPYVH